MSKQEKLAKLLAMIEQRYFGSEVEDAMADYRRTPDDPPPRPEMPECVSLFLFMFDDLVKWQTITTNDRKTLTDLAQAVRDHYAQPIKLEVGKVYVDEKAVEVKIFWQNRSGDDILGVEVETGLVRRYDKSGVCTDDVRNLIREVTNG